MTEWLPDPSPDQVESEALRSVLTWWRELMDRGAAIATPTIVLETLPEHIPFIAINDYEPETKRFFVRFYGSAYNENVGADYTGHYLDEIDGTTRLQDRYLWIVETKQPYLLKDFPLEWGPKSFKSYSVMCCPLFDTEGNVASVISRIEFS